MIKRIYYKDNLLKKYEKIYKKLGEKSNFQKFLNDYSYDIIKESGAFDENFYLEHYSDVSKLNINPITHYLEFGFNEGCNPNSLFNTAAYSKIHKDALKGINPFVHYLLYEDDGISNEIIEEFNNDKISPIVSKKILDAFEREITIVIPIYNAYEDTKKCIETVLEHTTVKYKLVLIDDKSTDSRISLLLDSYEDFENIYIIRNEVNKGFTKNVNIGISHAKNDVILLNSDTKVTPRWIQKIIYAAYSDEEIGTLTPISNASDISVPIMYQNNEIPSFLDVDSMSLLVEKSSVNGNLFAPTGNGFCLFIKRETLEDVGLFDEINFDRGYGEETDFTMRAKKNGWKNARNDSIFIYHKRSASFSLNKTSELKKEHKKILLKKHPTVFDEWNEFVKTKKLSKSVESIQNSIENFNDNLIKPNILYVTNLFNNKPKFQIEETLSQKFNIFLLTIDHSKLGLWAVHNNNFIFINKIKFNLNLIDFDKINCYYLKILKILNIELLFIQEDNPFRSLSDFSNLTPLSLAFKLGLPVVNGINSKDLLNPTIAIKKNKGIVINDIINNFQIQIDTFNSFYNDLIHGDYDIYNAIKLITEYGLFDELYYIKKYHLDLDIPPLLHYLYKGYLMGYNPCEIFDGNYYQELYPHIRQKEINPLVYFVLYGMKNGENKINKQQIYFK